MTARTNSTSTIEMIHNKLRDNNMEIYDIEECENEESITPITNNDNKISHAFQYIPSIENTKEKTFYKLGNNGSISLNSDNNLSKEFETVSSNERAKEKSFYKPGTNGLISINNQNKLPLKIEGGLSREKTIEKTFNKLSNNGLVIYDIAEDENESKISYNETDLYPDNFKDELDDEVIKTDSKDEETDDMTARLYQIILPNGNVLNGSFIRN